MRPYFKFFLFLFSTDIIFAFVSELGTSNFKDMIDTKIHSRKHFSNISTCNKIEYG